MSQSSNLHVAIIMDGNGRWARERGRQRRAGHRAGAQAVRRVVECAPSLGIDVLTLFAFSADNWQRPATEVSGLMRLFESYLRGETARCAAEGVRVSVIGRRDRLGPRLVAAIEAAEAGTVDGTRLRLNLAVDYSSRHAMRRGEVLPDVDLLIRTGGEQRLSDFLLWECAYAELLFTERKWPEFEAIDLEAAIAAFRTRERRYGRISESPADPGRARATLRLHV
ncbi:MAG TPA: polyprenyl diphosphate synthase [Longimicrobiales bacterium]|nr:polyprenyl diphosphate synthase [Longimicrobiales bacterium]